MRDKVKKQMSKCINCSEIKECGTVNRWFRDYSKVQIKKRLKEDCLCIDFNQTSESNEEYVVSKLLNRKKK